MDKVGFVLSAVGAAAGVAGAYFAYLAVDQRFRRRRRSPETPPLPAGQGSYDVFISYDAADSDWAERLAERLREQGLSVFLAAWIAPGLVVLLEQEKALLYSAHGVLVFSQGSMAVPAIAEEYAVLLNHARSSGGRFIPVVIDDVVLPPFAEIRKPVSFRNAAGRDYEDQVAVLARALRTVAGAP
jgi:TIR domain